MKLRGFEIAKGWEDRGIELPRRSTTHAAGYDIAAAADVTVPVFHPGIKPTLIPTGLKAYCQPDECFFIFNRSSGAGKGIVTANGVGVIDADYYGNSDTDGHFQVIVFNVLDHELHIKKGDRIAQVIFQKFLTVDNDDACGQRRGGFGSTDVLPKPIQIVYDLDDVLWDLTSLALQRAGIGDKKQTDFRVDRDPAFTDKEKDQAIAAFSDAQNYEDCEFYPGAEDIFDVASPEVEVSINSNSYSPEVIATKKQRLIEAYPNLSIEHQQINLVTPDSNRKEIGADVLVFIDDSPYNIAGSKAKFNLMPCKTWNTTKSACEISTSGDKIYRKTWRQHLSKYLNSSYSYVIPIKDLSEANEFVKMVIKLKQGDTKNGKE